jgi:hypothetical protein
MRGELFMCMHNYNSPVVTSTIALALHDNQPILRMRGGGVWSVECGVWSVECGVWSVDCGLWTVDCGLWTVDCGLWTVDCGLWTVDYGLWTVDCGLWTVDCGLWTVDCGLWTVDCGPYHRSLNNNPQACIETSYLAVVQYTPASHTLWMRRWTVCESTTKIAQLLLQPWH